jgi:glycosyltransferase involved in cell wall biosynthesis
MDLKRGNISVLISYYQASKYGGFYKYIHQLTKNLAKRRIKVHLVVKKNKNKSILEKSPNITVHYIPTNRKILFAVYCIFALIKITIQHKITCFHSHAIDEGVLSNILKYVFRRKQVLSLRANWWAWYRNRKENSRGLNRLIYALYLIIVPMLIKRTDGLIVTNSYLKKIVSKISVRKPVLLKQNVVDTALFNPDKITTTLKKAHNISYRPIIMYIGRLLLGKGLEYLIEAMSQLRNIYPDIMLILVGDGPHKVFSEELIEQKHLQKHVIFVGYQRNIPEWLAIADVFVLPSLTEGSSNVLLEAMSMNRPVIATAVGNAPDIIHHLKNGVLVEPKNAEQIAEHISVLLANKALANTIGMNARDTVVQNFSQFSVDDIIALYTKILDLSE